MNSLLKLYSPIMCSNRYSSFPCLVRDCQLPYCCSIPSSGKSLHIQKIQFIFVLALSSGLPRMSSEMSSPTANIIERSSISLLVRTTSGGEYRKSCSYTKSSFVRSRLAKASICANLSVWQVELTKSEEGLIYLGMVLCSLRCRMVCMRSLLILKISSFCSSPAMTSSRLRSRFSKIQQKFVQSLTISLMRAISCTLEVFMSEMFLLRSTSSQVVSRWSFLTTTFSRLSVFSARKKEYHLVLIILSKRRYFSIKQFYYEVSCVLIGQSINHQYHCCLKPQRLRCFCRHCILMTSYISQSSFCFASFLVVLLC